MLFYFNEITFFKCNDALNVLESDQQLFIFVLLTIIYKFVCFFFKSESINLEFVLYCLNKVGNNLQLDHDFETMRASVGDCETTEAANGLRQVDSFNLDTHLDLNRYLYFNQQQRPQSVRNIQLITDYKIRLNKFVC